MSRRLSDYLNEATESDADTFAEDHPHGFLVYARAQGPLSRVDVSAGATMNRALLDGDSVQTAMLPSDLYDVYEIKISDGAQESSVGSSSKRDIIINDESVSRMHAKILVEGELRIADAGSMMGTQVSGHTLDEGEEAPLRSGTRISLGPVELTYMTANALQLLVTQLCKS